MSMAASFTLGALYLGMIVAGSAAGAAIVMGQKRNASIAIAVAVCLIGGIAAAMGGLR